LEETYDDEGVRIIKKRYDSGQLLSEYRYDPKLGENGVLEKRLYSRKRTEDVPFLVQRFTYEPDGTRKTVYYEDNGRMRASGAREGDALRVSLFDEHGARYADGCVDAKDRLLGAWSYTDTDGTLSTIDFSVRKHRLRLDDDCDNRHLFGAAMMPT